MDDNRRSPEYRQARREALDQRKSDMRSRFVNNSACGAARVGAILYPADTGLADRVRASVGAWYDAHPHDPGVSIEQAVFHEAGHFVVAEALGMVAGKAEIRGSPFGRYGWGGSAHAWERPVHDGGSFGFTTDDVEREATFTLAGPMAEHLFAVVGPFAPVPQKCGDLYSGLGEFMEVCTVVAHLADLRRTSRTITLATVFAHTAQALLVLAPQIEDIARRLQSKKRVTYYERETAKILKRIGRLSLKNLPPLTDTEAESVHAIIADAPMDLVRFIEEVGQ